MIIYLYTVTKLKLYLFPDLIIWILLSCFWLKFVVFVHLRDSVLVIWMCYFQTWLQQMLKIVLFSFVIVHPIILNTIFSSKTSNIICFSLFFQLNLQNWRVDLWHLGRWKKWGEKKCFLLCLLFFPPSEIIRTWEPARLLQLFKRAFDYLNTIHNNVFFWRKSPENVT